MMFMTVPFKEKIYYFYKSENKFYVKCVEANKKYKLSIEQVVDLLKKLFTSKLTYLEDKDGYSIYLDDSKNKRYFKDNIEDLSMFFLVNGKEVINYMGFGYSDIKYNVKLLVNEAKIPLIASVLLGLVTFNILNITVVNHEGYETEVSVNDTTVIDEEGANIIEDVPPLTMKEVKELIYASPNLTQKQKEYLYNPEDIANVLHYVSPTRYEELRFRYTGLELQIIPEEEKKKYPNLAGYYNSSRFPHTLFLVDDSDYTFIGVAPHEKKHLDQGNHNYPFITEACAEIEAEEFWGVRATAYLSARSRLSFLMEMIGPRPILECKYNYDDSSLVAEINRYLDEDDANKLLNEFKKKPPETPRDNEIADLEVIDEMLAKMYKAIFPDKNMIYDPIYICTMKYLDSLDHYYFNQFSPIFNKKASVTYGSFFSAYNRKKDEDADYIEGYDSLSFTADELITFVDNTDSNESIHFAYSKLDGVSKEDNNIIYYRDIPASAFKNYEDPTIEDTLYNALVKGKIRVMRAYIDKWFRSSDVKKVLDYAKEGQYYGLFMKNGSVLEIRMRDGELVEYRPCILSLKPISERFPDQVWFHNYFIDEPQENSYFIPADDINYHEPVFDGSTFIPFHKNK